MVPSRRAEWPEHLGALLVGRRGLGGQAEGRVLVDEPEHDARDADQPGQPEAVLGDRSAEQLDGVGGQDRRALAGRSTELEHRQPDQHRAEAHRCDHLGQGGRAPQVPEDEQVGHQPDQRGHADRQEERRYRRHAVAEVDATRDPDPRQHQVALLPELQEHQRREGGHGPLGEVDHPRPAVGDDHAHGDGGVDRAGAGADERVEQPGRHGQGVVGPGGRFGRAVTRPAVVTGRRRPGSSPRACRAAGPSPWRRPPS